MRRILGATKMRGGAIRGLGAAAMDSCQYFMTLVALVGPSLQGSRSSLLGVCRLTILGWRVALMQQESKGENKSVRFTVWCLKSVVSGEHGGLPLLTPPMAWDLNTARGPRLVGWWCRGEGVALLGETRSGCNRVYILPYKSSLLFLASTGFPAHSQ